jgi:hypothetical protein
MIKVKKWKRFKKPSKSNYEKKIYDSSEVSHGSFGYDGKIGLEIAGKSV